MSLVWHIVRKDFRRLAGPLALWLALVLAHVSLLFVWEGQMGFNPTAFEGKRYFVNTCGVIVTSIGFILAAWLVMEDSLVSTRAFWRTRAIGRGRLLAAKALGAILMLSVLPVVVVTPVWLACGFSGRELAGAAFEMGLLQALCSMLAFALAGITETSGQFLIRMIGGIVVVPLYLTYVLYGFTFRSGGGWEVSEAVRDTRYLLVMGLMALIPLVMTVHQFLTRRVRRTWGIFLAGLGLMLAAGCWWPWALASRSAVDRGTEASGPVFTGKKLMAAQLDSVDSRISLQLDGLVAGLPSGGFVRVDRVEGWWIGGDTTLAGPRFRGRSANGQPREEMVRRLAGLVAPEPGDTLWTVTAMESREILEQARAGQLRLDGTVRATLMTGIVLGELPLRAGATLDVGSSHTRIKSVKWLDGNLAVLIEERDAGLKVGAGPYSQDYNPARQQSRPADGFVVLNRTRNFDQVPRVQEIGVIQADSIAVGRRSLVITPPEQGDDWLEDAVIVKVRFAPAQTMIRPLSGAPLELSR